jgi:ribosomal protein S12 methylthiotransferase accessory factor
VLDVYFAVAFPKAGPGDLHLSPIGSGCSLDIRTAIQRATTEQFQANALYGIAEEAIDKTTLDLLSGSDKLKYLIGFTHIRNLNLPPLDQPLTDFTASVPQQLKILQNNLLRAGKTIFHRTIARYSGDNVVSQCYVPGLERFNIIRNGCLVAPQHILRKTSKSLHLKQ